MGNGNPIVEIGEAVQFIAQSLARVFEEISEAPIRMASSTWGISIHRHAQGFSFGICSRSRLPACRLTPAWRCPAASRHVGSEIVREDHSIPF